MLLTEIKLALRILIKEIHFTLLNLVGLTIGISSSFLIFNYVSHELSYDKHIPDSEHIYRVNAKFTINGDTDFYSNSPRPVGPALVADFPGILISTKVLGFSGLQNHRGYLRLDDKVLESEDLFIADSNFFKVFDLQFLQGNFKALHEPNSAVISAEIALKLFETTSAIGKIFEVDGKTLKVTGVLKEDSKPTYLRPDVLMSYTTYYPDMTSEKWWYGGNVFIYIKCHPNFKPETVETNWPSFFNKYMKTTFDQMNGTASIELIPLKNIYTSDELIWEPYPHNSIINIRILIAIGLFIILVAGFNFLNMSLSQTSYRIKETSIQKVLGAPSSSIIRQHLMISLIISLFSGLLSVAFIVALNPIVSQLITNNISFVSQLLHPLSIIQIIGFSLLLGFIIGIYPATYLATKSSPNTKEIKSSIKFSIRKGFIVTQLLISIGVIIYTLIVIDQINFLRKREIGFDVENLVIVHLKDREIRNQITSIKNDLLKLPNILNVAGTNQTPATGANEFAYQMKNKEGEYVPIPSQTISVGKDFISTVGLQLIAGTHFENKDDRYRGIIINEFLAEKMGYSPEEVIGVSCKFGNSEADRKVIGVINNFILGSTVENNQAMSIGLRLNRSNFLLVRILDINQQQTISQIKQVMDKHSGGIPFTYSMARDEYQELLLGEKLLFKLLLIGSILIIIIAIIGLFGLSFYSVAKRTKEIGIRKVSGANKANLFLLLLREYVQMFLIALLIGSVIAWYFGNKWLDNYANHGGFNYFNILIAAIITSVAILIAISFHIMKVVRANPVESLRYE